MSKNLLLEIGTEEIPAGFMNSCFEQIKNLTEELFADNRIDIAKIRVTGTPRRLVLLIEDVEERQEDLEREVRGPAKRIAFDEEGNPSPAGSGFARGQGISPEELEVRDTESGEYVFAITREEGKEVSDLLPDILVEIIKGIKFSKPMRWANEEMRFARPIKWILSLYGKKVIDLSIAGVESSNWTLGHRFLSEGKVEVASSKEYFEKLAQEWVVVDSKEREELILKQIRQLEEKEGLKVIIDDELLHEVNFLVEYPTALVGSFSDEFLELPDEVLITSMKEHQRYFPVEDEKGNLRNLFITVRNGNDEYIDVVRAGNEKVLQARLSDAMFFYKEDQKDKLEDKVDKLKNIIFQEDLGTLYEKVERIQNLSDEIAQNLNLSKEKIKEVNRVAKLSKADLVTEMVNEFSKLQGVMGREYALIDGEGEGVANGIFEHYLPRYKGDILPSSEAGIIVSIADKIDNIVGCFSVGIIPTGSQDPYALRRQAQGVVGIIVDAGLETTLKDLINWELEVLEQTGKLKRSIEEVRADVLEFFKLRLENLLEEDEVRYDVINSILSVDYSNINDTLIRAKAMMEFREEEGFEELITAFNRVNNLAEKSVNDIVDEDLLEDASEKDLYSDYLDIKVKVESLTEKREYLKALQGVGSLKKNIDNFFDSVMVMDKRGEVKNNRLALLNLISNLLSRIGDLDKIVID
ncbi:glycine--tRNA ligase subunit beta [Halonatronum saccharophilum]|uniref:glycine--tRNA ligase subunit beta n=1 Tax=Halonatronum saccharophilum TaxID=150060 RepID=UPI00047F08C1|nr:glycine--tRNA ligase subunit beta [Halonatronum saccharophilum]